MSDLKGHPSPLHAAAAENSRVSAMLAAIEDLALKLEDCTSHQTTFPLATAIQACVESARRASDGVAEGIEKTSATLKGAAS